MENNGDEGLTKRTVASTADPPRSVAAADIDNDGDIDLASASDNTIAWYENIGEKKFTSHVVTTSAEGAQTVIAEDIDNDGDHDKSDKYLHARRKKIGKILAMKGKK